MITSAANPAIRMMRSLGSRKARRTERAFLVEGRRLTEEAVRFAPESVRQVLVREDVSDNWLRETSFDMTRLRRVAAPIFDAASDVDHAQGIAAMCSMPPDAGESIDAKPSAFILVLDQIRDPGNMGTILRSAAAAGVRTVWATRGCVDPFAPKVVRAGMGAHFRLNLGGFSDHAASILRLSSCDVVYADARAAEDYHAYDWSRARALVIGGETETLSEPVAEVVTQRVRIPMRGSMESLNAGVAASILLFEAQYRNALGDEDEAKVDNGASLR